MINLSAIINHIHRYYPLLSTNNHHWPTPTVASSSATKSLQGFPGARAACTVVLKMLRAV